MSWLIASLSLWFSIDQWHSDRKPLLDRCQEADRKVKGQAKNGCAEGRQGDPAEHPWPRWQHRFSQRLWPRRWAGCWVLGSAEMGRGWEARLVRVFFRLPSLMKWLLFDQTFQISILWHPTIPIDRMTDIAAAAPALQTEDLNPQTTPDTRPHRSAMAGTDLQATTFCYDLSPVDIQLIIKD